jgi:hypothetical protein
MRPPLADLDAASARKLIAAFEAAVASGPAT